MPKYWHDKHAANKIDDEDVREFNKRIVADKKPYFMRYIYPSLMKQYNQYVRNTDRNALREFQLTVKELFEIPKDELTEQQAEFLHYYSQRLPVGVGDCVMNKICRKFEDVFDKSASKNSSEADFDYRIMKSDEEYSLSQYYAIKKLFDDYHKQTQNYMIFSNYERVDSFDSAMKIASMNEEFRKECDKICPNQKMLCNIVLDICYKKNSSKKFAWSICGEQIIHNLLSKNNNIIRFPVVCTDGDISYCGGNYKIESREIEVGE